MELRKQSENINRAYDNNGGFNDSIDSVQYQILDSEGNVIGSANISSSYADANFNISGFSTIEEGEKKLKTLFGEANG